MGDRKTWYQVQRRGSQSRLVASVLAAGLEDSREERIWHAGKLYGRFPITRDPVLRQSSSSRRPALKLPRRALTRLEARNLDAPALLFRYCYCPSEAAEALSKGQARAHGIGRMQNGREEWQKLGQRNDWYWLITHEDPASYSARSTCSIPRRLLTGSDPRMISIRYCCLRRAGSVPSIYDA